MITLAEISRLRDRAAVERFVSERFDGDAAKFASDISASLNQLLQTDLKKSARFVKLAGKCFACLPKEFASRYLALQARLAHWSGNSKEAVRKYSLAIRQFEKTKQHQLAAQTRQGLMDAYMYLGRHEEALTTGKKALSYFRKNRQEANAARVMTNIGNVYHRLDRNREALQYYDRARAIFEKQGGLQLALVDFNRANIYTNLNRLDEAEKLYRQTAEIYHRQGLAIAEAKIEYSLAYLYFLQSRYTDSLATFDRVMDSFKKLGDSKAVAITTLDLAEINTHLNQLGSTVMLGQEAKDACGKLGLRYEEAKAAYFVAEGLRHFGDYPQATRYLSEAERLFRKERNRLWLGMVGLERAKLLLESGKLAAATRRAVAAQRLFGASGDERRSIDAEITVIETAFAGSNGASSQRRALQLLKRRPAGYQEYQLHCLLGQRRLRESQPAAALKHFRQAIVVAEKMLLNLQADEGRFFFALSKQTAYNAAIDCLLKLGKPKKSFLQNLQALSVLNQRRPSDATTAREVPEKLLRVRDNLRAALKQMSRTPESSPTRALTSPALQQMEHRLYTHERKIASLLSSSTSVQSQAVKSESPRLDMLADDEVLINPIKLSEGVCVFCAEKGQVDFVRCAISADTLETTIRELHFLMENAVYLLGGRSNSQAAINAILRRLYDWLFEPLAGLTGKRRLILLVDGLFAQIPFAALPDAEGRLLKDRFALSVIVSPDNLIDKDSPAGLDRDKSSAVFAPPASGLPMVGIEGKKIGALFPKAKLYLDDTASSANLRRELEMSEGFVHIATHASRSSENPLFSRLLLSDGPFFPFDLFGCGVRAQLVTLSGCQTAAPGIYYANSFSLARAFYQAGARFVLASLWPVSDKLSMVFMTEFYRSLNAGADIPSAYHVALDRVRSMNNNPAFWAPYVLLGI